MPKVLIVGNDPLISNMFLKRGWEVVKGHQEAPDLVQFTGGEDVSPSLYGEIEHPASFINPARDQREANVYLSYKDTPKAGICRGGQFLNVMNGGRMWQHVTNHTRTHSALDLDNGREYEVTSTHHQMMIPHESGRVLLIAAEGYTAAYKQCMEDGRENTVTNDKWDVESVFYGETKTLCFQPHPEYVGDDHECRDLYFTYLEQHLGLKA